MQVPLKMYMTQTNVSVCPLTYHQRYEAANPAFEKSIEITDSTFNTMVMTGIVLLLVVSRECC